MEMLQNGHKRSAGSFPSTIETSRSSAPVLDPRTTTLSVDLPPLSSKNENPPRSPAHGHHSEAVTSPDQDAGEAGNGACRVETNEDNDASELSCCVVDSSNGASQQPSASPGDDDGNSSASKQPSQSASDYRDASLSHCGLNNSNAASKQPSASPGDDDGNCSASKQSSQSARDYRDASLSHCDLNSSNGASKQQGVPRRDNNGSSSAGKQASLAPRAAGGVRSPRQSGAQKSQRQTAVQRPQHLAFRGTVKSPASSSGSKAGLISPANSSPSKARVRSPVNSSAFKAGVSSIVNSSALEAVVGSPVDSSPCRGVARSLVNSSASEAGVSSPVNSATSGARVGSPVNGAHSQQDNVPNVSMGQTGARDGAAHSAVSPPEPPAEDLNPSLCSPATSVSNLTAELISSSFNSGTSNATHSGGTARKTVADEMDSNLNSPAASETSVTAELTSLSSKQDRTSPTSAPTDDADLNSGNPAASETSFTSERTSTAFNPTRRGDTTAPTDDADSDPSSPSASEISLTSELTSSPLTCGKNSVTVSTPPFHCSTPVELRSGRSTPEGISSVKPRRSWTWTSADLGSRQTAKWAEQAAELIDRSGSPSPVLQGLVKCGGSVCEEDVASPCSSSYCYQPVARDTISSRLRIGRHHQGHHHQQQQQQQQQQHQQHHHHHNHHHPDPRPDDVGKDPYLTPSQRKVVAIRQMKQQLQQMRHQLLLQDQQMQRCKQAEEVEKEQIRTQLLHEVEEARALADASRQEVTSLQEQLEESVRTVAMLQEQVRSAKTEMAERLGQAEEIFLEMYKKGRESAIFEREEELELQGKGACNVDATEAELRQKLVRTQAELAKWQTLQRHHSYHSSPLPVTEAETTLRFLKDAVFHFLTSSRKSSEEHLKAVVDILRFSQVQREKIHHVLTTKRKKAAW